MDLSQFAEVLNERFSQPLAADVASWSPPQDPDKPSLPYLPGFNVTIRPHNIAETEQPRQNLKPEYLRTVTQSKAVVNNPSRFSSPGPDDAESAALAITASISIGTTRGAQIVACTITPCQKNGEEVPKPFQAVAKIYDPLYYNFKSSIGRYPRDTVREADKDYENETAAYEHLRKHGITGSFAPKYYGSWIFSLPITIGGRPHSRNVQMILIETLNGVSIQETRVQNSSDRSGGTDSFHYPEEYRLEVLARAMDAYVKQLKIGLEQGDFAGRNVILVANSPEEDKVGGLVLPRVVLVDYNTAKVVEMPREQANWLPSNPAAVFWNEYLWEDFGGWVPNEWQDWKTQQDWLMQRFNGDDHRHHYYPSQEFFDNMLAARR
ncbi:hypothetical protein N8I77_002758 [Diaporthe amygdali]|uniref:Uncharacterized protein n=1 Tax=Phomopsis amygdali TaxID=1214568 RepID=A0AAD9STE3_PHOAM|nr:hypothetical protein N8I77_002758 [Diaporthe amygdali]